MSRPAIPRDIRECSSWARRWAPSWPAAPGTIIHLTCMAGFTTRTQPLMATTPTIRIPGHTGTEARLTDRTAALTGEPRITRTPAPTHAEQQHPPRTAAAALVKPTTRTPEPTARPARGRMPTGHGGNR